MDAELRTSTAPMRDPRYAPRRLVVEDRGRGEFVLTNPADFSTRHTTMTSALDHWAQATPDRPWLAERSGDGWRTLSFAEARERVAVIAGGLQGLGIVGGRPLLILSKNAIEHALITYAAISQGMPVAPVSPQYGLKGANLARLSHACEVLRPAAVYTEDTERFADGLSADCLAGLPVIAAAKARPGDTPLAALTDARPAAFIGKPDDHAKYLLTSGSTGLPKAVILTQANIALNIAQITACFDDPDPPVILHSAPWSHSLGANTILHQALQRGGTYYLDHGQPTAAGFGETLRNLREIPGTFQHMVPAGWMLLVDELEKDDALARVFFQNARLLQYGGAALGQATADRIQAVAVRTVGERISFASGYGATETGPTATNTHWPNDRMGLLGLPIPGTSVRLVPEAGKLDFRVKGPQVTQGYLNRQELSAAAFDEEGFYRLGDAARFVDPADPHQGLAFDGRLSENFKLASGTFVTVGDLRVAAVGAIGGAVTDAVVCGEGREALGLLLYPNPNLPRDQIEAAVRVGLTAFNARAKGSGGRIARALVLPDPPDAASGEITDKGYIAQSLARTRRAAALERLFADPPPTDVMVISYMNGADALISTLVANDVTACFANPGTSEMQFVKALDGVPQMRPVLCLFEGVATGAADGYGRIAEKPACTLLHLGPGYGNGLANLHNARRAYTPVVNVVGDHATYHRQYDAPLNSDIPTIVKPNSIWVKSADSPDDVASLTAEAVAASYGPPGGPVSLILPADSAWLPTEKTNAIAQRTVRPAPKGDAVEAAARAIRAASKPVLLLGGDACLAAGAAQAGRLFAAGIQVFTDTFAARYPRGAGSFAPRRMQYFGEMALQELEGVDLMVFVGTTMPVAFFAYPNRPSVLVPEGCQTLTLAHRNEDSVAGLQALADALGAPREGPIQPQRLPDGMPTGPLSPQMAGLSIARHMPEGAIIADDAVTSGGGIAVPAMTARPHQVIALTGGAIGDGMPMAIGAAVAAPDRKVISLNGDGSAMYTVQSLWTMARENLDITTVVFANHSYRILNIEMIRTGAGEAGASSKKLLDLSDPKIDWVSVAKGLGLPAVRCTTAEEFDKAFEAAMAGKGPTFIEAAI